MLFVKLMEAFHTAASCSIRISKIKTLVCTITDMLFAYLKALFSCKNTVIKIHISS